MLDQSKCVKEIMSSGSCQREREREVTKQIIFRVNELLTLLACLCVTRHQCLSPNYRASYQSNDSPWEHHESLQHPLWKFIFGGWVVGVIVVIVRLIVDESFVILLFLFLLFMLRPQMSTIRNFHSQINLQQWVKRERERESMVSLNEWRMGKVISWCRTRH